MSAFLSLQILFAKSHATLRAHLSWCKVSSCDLFSHFWMDSLGCTLSFPNVYVVPCALGEFHDAIRSQFPNCPQKRLFRRVILGHTTTCVDSFSKATDPSHHFSSTSYWAAQQPQCVQTVVAVCASRFRLVILTNGSARDHTTVPYTFL